MQHVGVAAPEHGGASRTRDRTRVLCTGRWSIIDGITREIPRKGLLCKLPSEQFMRSQHIPWALLPKPASLLGPCQTSFQGFPLWASNERAEAFQIFQQGLLHCLGCVCVCVCVRARACVCVCVLSEGCWLERQGWFSVQIPAWGYRELHFCW